MPSRCWKRLGKRRSRRMYPIPAFQWARLWSEDGSIVTGCNVEMRAIHSVVAERVAVGTAVAAGRHIRAVAVTAEGGQRHTMWRLPPGAERVSIL